MNAEKREIVNGKMIEEFYWNGKTICYINNILSSLTFEEARSKELKALVADSSTNTRILP